MRWLLACLALGWSIPASAESLSWDYSSYPPLEALTQALMKNERQEAMYVEDRAPVYVLQRFITDGKSASEWAEAVEVLNTMRRAEPKSPAEWYRRFQQKGLDCPSNWTLIAQDKKSVTFRRDSQACPPQPAQSGFYRVVYGKQQVFVLMVTNKGAVSEEKRKQILTMLASAEIR
jgi:hypothetical protein